MSITDYHKAIFSYLEKYRRKHPRRNFTYALRQKNTKDRPRNLYYFTGNESYIFIGMYAPNNSNTKTRTIGFSCWFDGTKITQSNLEISFNIPRKEAKQVIYKKIITTIGIDKFKKIGDRKYILAYEASNWEQALEIYLNKHKPIIDEIINESGLAHDFFISKDELERSIKVATTPTYSPDEGNKEALQQQMNQDISNDKPAETKQEINKMHSQNIILYGPPGTGKTYGTIDLAVEIITKKKNSNHSVNKKIFDELSKNNQIEFVTFHQNYTYEDFVIGIRPELTDDQNSNGLSFEQKEGVFYRISKRAEENYRRSEQGGRITIKSFDTLIGELVDKLQEKKEVDIKTKSGNPLIVYLDEESQKIMLRVSTGSSYPLYINILKKTYEGTATTYPNQKAYYVPIADYLRSQSEEKVEVPESLKNYVLIIDEINRANMSRVFGELITLLEDDKRLGEPNELTITLPSDEPFSVPPNLYLIGTMNTADKSLALLDIALRRRFDFIYQRPDSSVLNKPVGEIMDKLNREIRKTKSADFLIGHAYFIGKTENDLPDIFNKRVIPLLMEYFNGNAKTVVKLLGEAGITAKPDEITDQLTVSYVE